MIAALNPLAPPQPPSAPARPIWSPRLCLWHWLGARIAVLTACALALQHPDGIAASPYHPTTLACAHLLVLGFLATMVVGAYHVVAPLALRVHVRATWVDWALFATILVVASGVASHMALGTYNGVTWSGGLLVAVLLLRVPRWWMDLASAPVPLALRCGIALAWLALVLTACLGIALAIDRGDPFLPGGHQAALFGHAHLGLAGFGFLMVVALGQRLLPMFLPAAPPPRGLAWAAVLGTALGAYGIGMSLPLLPEHGPWFAAVLALGVVAFLGCGVAMLRARKPRPADLPRPDPTAVLVGAAFVSLVAAAVLGLGLAFGLLAGPRWQLTYGICALLGCLGSLVFGIGARLLPLAGWHAAWHDAGKTGGPPRAPRLVAARALAHAAAIGWVLATAILAGAAAAGSGTGIAVGTWLVAVSVTADTANVLVSWRRRHGGAVPADAT